ncbi:hypothetical protein OO184_15920 [Photorhabdus sp. APURE]|nr:hypothetical protein [Photorhabdus aballayi]MCW7549380.1 hypothetical protein [Photorhabdus aballayi]
MNNKEKSKLVHLLKQVTQDKGFKNESSRPDIIFVNNAGEK